MIITLCRALLRETAEAPLTRTLGSGGNSGNKDNGALSRHFGLFAEEEMARLGADLVRDSELALDPTTAALPSELLADLDHLPGSARPSIEVGRRALQSPAGLVEGGEGSPFAGAELFRPSLPYSPLRKGAAVGSSLDMMMEAGRPGEGKEKEGEEEQEEEAVPLNDLVDPYDYGMGEGEGEGEIVPAVGGEGGRPSAELPSIAGIDAVVSVKAQKRSTSVARVRRQVRSARRLPLDSETELSNVSVQALVRNPLSLLLPPRDVVDATLRGCLSLLNQQFGETAIQGEGTKKGGMAAEISATRLEPVPPTNEDGEYLLGPEDYAMDLVEEGETGLGMGMGAGVEGLGEDGEGTASAHRSILMSSPKSPRLMLPIEDDENAVPDHNHHRSAPGTPSKAVAASTLKLQLAEAALDTLERWQQCLHLERPVEFDGGLLKSGTARREAAEAFHQLLILTSKGLVRTEQMAPYGSLMVRATAALFTATTADVAQ